MEQGPEKRPFPGGRRLAAAGTALCLACAVVLTGGGVRAAQTAAPMMPSTFHMLAIYDSPTLVST